MELAPPPNKQTLLRTFLLVSCRLVLIRKFLRTCLFVPLRAMSRATLLYLVAVHLGRDLMLRQSWELPCRNMPESCF